jgi:ATP-dependent DNA helicase RecG
MENNMMQEELEELISELTSLPKETEWVEFKSGDATINEMLGKYIAALSNAACIANQPFGYIVFGIEDQTHEIVGTNYKFKNKKEGSQELELWIRNLLHPSIKFEHFTLNIDDKYLEIFKIPAASGEPTYFKTSTFIRFNSSITDLIKHPAFMKAIFDSQIDWSAKIIENATIHDLDTNAIAIAKQKFIEKKPTALQAEIAKWDDATFLDKAKITIGRKITNTAILLLGNAESTHLISPAVGQITWKLDTEEKAYEHFSIPFFTTTTAVLNRIRNVNYKFFPDNQLVSVEVIKYDTEVILEALNNCIAHQDYSQNARIVLTEKFNKLIFENEGAFFEGTAEDYSMGNATPKKYRNKWLAEAMVNLNMIDSLGYGIHKMYKSQLKRYFPLPDYSKSTNKAVVLEIYGHTIDENYSKLLIERKETLGLTDVILLDKVQKEIAINDDAAKLLKKKKLIEGRKPHYFVSASVAEITGQKTEYMNNKGIEDDYCKKIMKDYLTKFKKGSRADFQKLMDGKLSASLTLIQQRNKVKNLLQAMKRDNIIHLKDDFWRLNT